MRMLVCAVMDVQAQCFMQPMFVQSKGVALRMLGDEVNRNAHDNVLFNHPNDFRLFELGEWDNNSGLFVCHAQPVLVSDLSALKL